MKVLTATSRSMATGRGHRPAIQNYLSNTDDSLLPRLFAQQSTLPNAEQYYTHDYHGPPSRSYGTSVMLSGGDHTRNSGTQDLAALTRASSRESPASIQSSMGARQLDNQPLLEPDQAGALVVGPMQRGRMLECPFNLLYCFESFADTDDRAWILHSLTHFGRVDPPKYNRCCFCEAAFESPDGVRSWYDRMKHVFLHHRLGHSLSCARPDFRLYTYLWSQRVINDAIYRDIKGNSADRHRHVQAFPTAPASPNERSTAVVYTAYSGSRRSPR